MGKKKNISLSIILLILIAIAGTILAYKTFNTKQENNLKETINDSNELEAKDDETLVVRN